MTFSAAMLAEWAKTGGEYYKRVTINFPADSETITLSPDATTLTDANHGTFPVTSIHLVLDDPPATPDEDTTYVVHNAIDTTGESRVSFPSLPSWVVDIQAVRIFCRARSQATSDGAAEDDGSWQFAARVNSTNYLGSIVDSRFFNPDFRTMVIEFAQSPDTSTDWTIAEVNALEVAIIGQPDAQGDTGGLRFTQVYIQIDASRSRVGRYSDIAINSKADGLFESRVIGWDSVTYSVVGGSNAIQRPSCGVKLADTDQELNLIFDGTGVDEVRRSTVVIEYVSPNVDRADWATVFTGLLTSWEETEPHVWDLGFAQDDSTLNGHIPKAKISERDFEDADPTEYDRFLQVVYGRLVSAGITDDGMIRCPNVDQVRFRRLVAAHHVKAVLAVYSKGNTEDPAAVRTFGTSAGNALTAEYQIITPIINGRQYTIAEFNLAGASQEEIDKFNELTISCDVEGVEETGDGKGLLITNPATMFKHFYVNWVVNDYGSGVWFLDSTAPIDVALWNETRDFHNLQGQEASRLIGGESNAKRGRDELNSWAFDMNARVFWTEEGKLGVLPHPPFTLDIYIDDPWFIQGSDDIGTVDYMFDTSELFDRVLLSHLHQHNGNQFLSNIEIRDFENQEERVETIQSFWLSSAEPLQDIRINVTETITVTESLSFDPDILLLDLAETIAVADTLVLEDPVLRILDVAETIGVVDSATVILS